MEIIKDLYKGFVRSKSKRPIDKLKDVTCYRRLEDILPTEDFMGVLADNTILIDIDDYEQSELLMNIIEDLQINCVVYATTRGRHFLFKNDTIDKCKTHTRLAIGLTADIKTGLNNISAQALRVDGQDRFCEWLPATPSNIDYLPKWLYPVKSNIDVLNLGDGDGRNDSLFRYILDLQKASLTKEESRETINIINTYIFKDKLSNSEIETITRDEAFPEDMFFEKNKFLHSKFAEFMINNYHIKRIDGQLYSYDSIGYMPGEKRIEHKMLNHLKNLTTQQRREVLNYIDVNCVDNTPQSSFEYVAFNNGVYDINTGQLFQPSPDIIITNRIPHDYNPSAYDSNVDKVLNKLAVNDSSIRAILEEAIGYCYYRRSEKSKFFILVGDKSNGKSTFLDMIRCLLGEDNYTSYDLSKLDNPNSTANMAGKLANIGDDIKGSYINDDVASSLKKIVSGNKTTAKFLYANEFEFKPYLKLFFSANQIPRINDPSGAVQRRLVIVPMNAKISEADSDFDSEIIDKITTENAIQYLINLSLAGLKRVLQNGFTKSEAVIERTKEYEIENNHILEWVNEVGVDFLLENTTVKCREVFNVWSLDNDYEKLSSKVFNNRIRTTFGMITYKKNVVGYDGKKTSMLYFKSE